LDDFMSFFDQFLGARSAARDFASTHWSVVLLAGKEHSPESAAALEKLCRAYWYPLYSFTRRQGYGPHEAADLTQDFFSHLLATNALASVDRGKGKFRSFLLASLKNLLANEWNRARCQKRGGGAPLFSLDEGTAEGRYQLEPADDLTPDKMFQRRWAETILGRALDRLRRECDDAEKTRRFDEVKTFLLGERTDSLAAAAARLNLSLAALKGLVHRLRRRFRELIRDEISQTVSRPEDIEQEIRDLFASFGD
jgi:DNA-directed RNA polymerase specialized sigma24 family protein